MDFCEVQCTGQCARLHMQLAVSEQVMKHSSTKYMMRDRKGVGCVWGGGERMAQVHKRQKNEVRCLQCTGR